MKSKIVLMSVILAGLFFACNKSGKADTLEEKSALAKDTAVTMAEASIDILPDSIDLSKVPFSEKELSTFPVFNPLADLAPLNKPLTRDFDRLFFPTWEAY